MDCTNCGHTNPDDASVCEQCGVPLPINVDAKPSNPPVPIGETAPTYPTTALIVPSGNKSFPWGWVAGGCAVLVLGIVVVAIGVFALFKLVPSLGKLTVQTGSSSPGTSSGTIGTLPFIFSTVNNGNDLASQSLFSAVSETLKLNNDTDFQAPKQYKGSFSLAPGAPFSLGNGWCAKDEATLKNNLASMQYTLSINNTNVDLSKYPLLSFKDDRGEACAETGLNITPPKNAQGTYQIKLVQRFLKPIEDGISAAPYPAGDVTMDFSVRFQSGGGPGTNL